LYLVKEALTEPIKITIAVFVAGLLFRLIRPKVGQWAAAVAQRLGYSVLFFIIVVGLGLLSSVITAIIAALVLSEVISALRLPRALEVKIVIIACFSIGLGAALTPLGEPLATIAVSKLRGEPYHADFFFLLRMLGLWLIPLILGLGVLPAFLKNIGEGKGDTLTEDRPELLRDVALRALKVYLFVLALVFLGTGFMPVVDKYLVHVPAGGLYWINIISAILDNATLTAAEITPLMSAQTIKYALFGLLIAGGMLIPGNIPNIICAGKLSIKSKEWAAFGVPLGMVIMVSFFLVLLLLG
jgi:predicted cation transporter